VDRLAPVANCLLQPSQELKQEIPWEILILAFRTDVPRAVEKRKAPVEGAPEKSFYFQNNNFAGAFVPRFQTLFLDWFVQLAKNQAPQGA
jgi:hypothetical protein